MCNSLTQRRRENSTCGFYQKQDFHTWIYHCRMIRRSWLWCKIVNIFGRKTVNSFNPFKANLVHLQLSSKTFSWHLLETFRSDGFRFNLHREILSSTFTFLARCVASVITPGQLKWKPHKGFFGKTLSKPKVLSLLIRFQKSSVSFGRKCCKIFSSTYAFSHHFTCPLWCAYAYRKQ